MEVSGVALRPLPCFSGVGTDTHSSKLVSSSSSLSFAAGNEFSGELRVVDFGGKRVCARARKVGFMDDGQLGYYEGPRCGLKKEKKKKKDSDKASVKKKLKLVKGLAKDLLSFSSMGFGVEVEEGLLAQVQGNKISEAAEVLLAQLQQLRAEEKEMKRKKKEEKARLKGAQIRTKVVSEASSSSSESSDGECGEVVDMSVLRKGMTIPESQTEIQEEEMVMVEGRKDQSVVVDLDKQIPIGSVSSVTVAASSNKIEVCMGGKCKKLGAPTLMEELESRVGIDGAVVGCKCMGKCRNGPNVRVLNHETVDTTTNPLCIGVSLEDVGVIVHNFFDQGRKEMGLMAA